MINVTLSDIFYTSSLNLNFNIKEGRHILPNSWNTIFKITNKFITHVYFLLVRYEEKM